MPIYICLEAQSFGLCFLGDSREFIENVDICACINFSGFDLGNFTCIKISVLSIIGSLG